MLHLVSMSQVLKLIGKTLITFKDLLHIVHYAFSPVMPTKIYVEKMIKIQRPANHVK